VSLLAEDLKRLKERRDRFLKIVAKKGVVYGFNTGLGKLAERRLGEEDLDRFQYDTLRTHATSTGSPLPIPYVRAAMFLRMKHLLRGASGVRPVVVERLGHLLNLGITPRVPERGSVGASGDLSPNAHVALTLIGEGWVFLKDGREVPSIVAHRMFSLEPLRIVPREALALINGYTFSLAVALLNVYRFESLLKLYHEIFPMVWFAVRGRKDPFKPEAVEIMGDRFVLDVARQVWKRIRDLPDGARIQDPYSIRTYPQVMGSAHRTVSWASKALVELASGVSDNPVLIGEDVVSTGNFHGQTIAQVCDALSISMATLIGFSDRRLAFMLSSESGLPPMLSSEPGLNSGLMMLQVATAALFAESKMLATPLSFQSSPTSAGQEDWVPMSFVAALRLGKLNDLLTEVLAAELLATYVAFNLTGKVPASISKHYENLKARMPQYRTNLHLAELWEVAKEYVRQYSE